MKKTFKVCRSCRAYGVPLLDNLCEPCYYTQQKTRAYEVHSPQFHSMKDENGLPLPDKRTTKTNASPTSDGEGNGDRE